MSSGSREEYAAPIRERYVQGLQLRWPGSLTAEIALRSLNGEEAISRAGIVMLSKVGHRGCQFRSRLRFPIREDAVWLFKLKMGQYTAHLSGVITGIDRSGNYHLRWLLTGFEQQHFEYRFNQYMQSLLTGSPRVLKLYRAICQRQDEQFHGIDLYT